MGSRELFSVPSIDELFSQTSQAVLPTMAESISQPILKTPSQPSQESSGSQERSAINSVRRLRFQETVEEKTISEEPISDEPISDEPDSMEVDAIEEEEEVEEKVEKHDESVYLSPNASFEDEEETEKEVQKLTESAVEEKEELKEDEEEEKEEEEKEEEKDDDLTPQVDKREEYEEILSDDMNELQ